MFGLTKLIIKCKNQIPLFYISFDHKHFQTHGGVKSCRSVTHPLLREDMYIKDKLNELVNYIEKAYAL